VKAIMANLLKAVAFAHQLQRGVIAEGSRVVDATVGKGYDTEFLARLVGEQGKVYGFDIQGQALDWTKERLCRVGLEDRVVLYHTGHEQMEEYIHTTVQAVMFNLGYLPGSDHEIITRPETTQLAVAAALRLLAVGGLITIVVYPGHAGGSNELETLLEYLSTLPQKQYTVLRYQMLNQVNNPPLVIAIEKLA
jgi:predicted methyltransferase